MIEFRNIHSTVKLVLDCDVKNYQDIPENIINIIDAVCNSNNYFWKITHYKQNNVPIIPASLLEVYKITDEELEKKAEEWVKENMDCCRADNSVNQSIPYFSEEERCIAKSAYKAGAKHE